MRRALLASAALALWPLTASAHCHVQYQLTAPAGLFYQVDIGGWPFKGVVPGGTASALGPPRTWNDIEIIELDGAIAVNLTATDLSGSVSCPAVSLDLSGGSGGMACTDDERTVPPPCTPAFTVTQTGPHSFSCSSACIGYPQAHVSPVGFTPPSAPAPALASVSPNSAGARSQSMALTLSGSGFTPYAQALWNGGGLPTVYGSGSAVYALLPSTLMTAAFNSVSVSNAGAASPGLPFSVAGGAAGPGVDGPGVGRVRVFPNPWRASLGAPGVTFDSVPSGSTVDIFTLSGRLVRTLDAPAGSANWDLRNKSGGPVASGYYLFVVRDGQGNRARGKVALIR